MPHTSNWDFPIGLLTRRAVGVDIKFLGKHSLFIPPFGWLFRWLGGYPVDRRKRTNLVDSVVDIFNQHDEFVISIAPEGTRKKVDALRTGFYYIARKAGIPILLCSFNYQIRTVLFGPLFYPGPDPEKAEGERWAMRVRKHRAPEPKSVKIDPDNPFAALAALARLAPEPAARRKPRRAKKARK